MNEVYNYTVVGSSTIRSKLICRIDDDLIDLVSDYIGVDDILVQSILSDYGITLEEYYIAKNNRGTN